VRLRLARGGMILLLLLAGVVRSQEPEPRLGPGDSVALFNGKDLSEWVTRGGPYDGDARWTVEDGVIVGRQGPRKAGGLLYTRGLYRDFILSLEVKVDHPFDSGLFVRMGRKGPGAQLTLDDRPGGEIGAVYSGRFLQHQPKTPEAWKRNQWNRITLRCTGAEARLKAWINGVLVTTYVPDDEAPRFLSVGRIGLQVHGGEEVPDHQSVRFRRIRLRVLPAHDDHLFSCDAEGFLDLKAAGREAGWVALFDGKNLDAWMDGPVKESALVKDRCLLFPSRGKPGTLVSRRDFRDFDLRLDFRITDMANSGVFLRAARDGSNPAYSGCEIQILDDFNWERETRSRLKPWQFTGSLYGSVPPGSREALRPNGQWNTYEITYVGTRLTVDLNGVRLYDVDTLEVPGKPFARRAAEGFIGLQRYSSATVHGDVMVAFRNIFVRPR